MFLLGKPIIRGRNELLVTCIRSRVYPTPVTNAAV